jgi:predicted GNAT family acetyltransferase
VIWTLEKIGIAKKVYTTKISEIKRANQAVVAKTLTRENPRALAPAEM